MSTREKSPSEPSVWGLEEIDTSHKQMARTVSPAFRYAALALVAGVPRITGALLFPNVEFDAYAYVTLSSDLKTAILTHDFGLQDLFGFWMPLYPLVAALFALLFDHALYVAKLITALCGIGVCLMVYALSMRLTTNRVLAVLAFVIVAFNPMHLLFSSSSMTDVPYAMLLLSSLILAMQARWLPAAFMVCLAAAMRFEAWAFIAILPMLQLLSERRITLATIPVLLLSPVIWLFISWHATGNPFEYFAVRERYAADYLAFHPEAAHFTMQKLAGDAEHLLYAVNPVILMAPLFAGARLHRSRATLDFRDRQTFGIAGTLLFFTVSLAVLLLAYFTNQQPVIWVRYGLVIFVLGLPLLAWLLSRASWQSSKSKIFALIMAAFFLWQIGAQTVHAAGFVLYPPPQAAVADYLRKEYNADRSLRVFSDDPGVRVLSGIPLDRFLDSSKTPGERDQFLAHLKETQVRYLVFTNFESSTPARIFPQLKEGKDSNGFRLVLHAKPIGSWRDEVWLYSM